MNTESLPNEIFLDLFDYFNGINLLHGFYGLNSRFNFLLYKQFRTYRFEFNSVSKRNFDMICQQHLPFITDKVVTLSLSDANETPEQINQFYSYIPSLSQFTHLQSLSIIEIYSYTILMKILDECHHLYNLISLDIYTFTIQVNDQVDSQLIVNSIWSLPKLIYGNFAININGQQFFCIPTTTSSTIERLSIYDSELELNQVNRLFEYTPRLKRLSISNCSVNNINYIPSLLPTLIDLRGGTPP